MKTMNKIVWLLLSSLSLFACSNDSKKQIPTEEKKSLVASSLAVSTVKPIGKPSAPIAMSYKILTDSPQPGDEIEIAVQFQSSVDSAIATKLNSAKKLSWLSSKKQWKMTRKSHNKPRAIAPIKVMAEKQGVYYIHLMASVVDGSGKVLYKPFTIPVKVGNGEVKLESVGEVTTDDKGQKIIIQNAN